VNPYRIGRRLWSAHRIRLRRYATTSVICTAFTIAGLAVCVGLFQLPAGWSNFGVVLVALPVNFELSRRWVWSHSGPRRWMGQAVPFAAFSLVGLGLSTLCVHEVAISTSDWARATRTTAVELANLTAFGSLWLLQYVALDRLLFSWRPEWR